MTLFDGVGVALVTLFDHHGAVDAPATAEHAARLVDLGVRGVVVAGSTGEAATLAPDERTQLLTAVRAAVPDDVPVVAGTGVPARRDAAALTGRAREAGADAVLVLSPPHAADLAGYYRTVAEAADELPVLAYHFPLVSAPGIPVEALARLPVAGVKDSTGDPVRLADTLDAFAGRVYVGSPAVLAHAGALRCDGAILALANVLPERCIAALAGDGDAQRALREPHRAASERFPHGLKGLIADRFATSTTVRLG